MFSFFKKFKSKSKSKSDSDSDSKSKYKTIAVRHHTIRWTDRNDQLEVVTYICKENGFGERKVDIHSYGMAKQFGYDKNNDLYHKSILPWVEHDPDLEKKQEKQETPKIKNEKIKVKKEGNLITLDDRRKDK